jgi:hypothetical protein
MLYDFHFFYTNVEGDNRVCVIKNAKNETEARRYCTEFVLSRLHNVQRVTPLH